MFWISAFMMPSHFSNLCFFSHSIILCFVSLFLLSSILPIPYSLHLLAPVCISQLEALHYRLSVSSTSYIIPGLPGALHSYQVLPALWGKFCHVNHIKGEGKRAFSAVLHYLSQCAMGLCCTQLILSCIKGHLNKLLTVVYCFKECFLIGWSLTPVKTSLVTRTVRFRPFLVLFTMKLKRVLARVRFLHISVDVASLLLCKLLQAYSLLIKASELFAICNWLRPVIKNTKLLWLDNL